MLKTIIVCESTRGGTDSKLLKELILKHNLLDDENCEIHTTDDREKKSTGSITDVLDFLKLQLSNYTRGKFENVLIIVDADDNIKTRFDEIKKCLDIKYFEVQQNITSSLPTSSQKINVGIFLFPNNQDTGSLELLCLNALCHPNLKGKLECINNYVTCIGNIDGKLTENNKAKSKIRIYMATPVPDRYVSSFVESIDYDSIAFKKLKDFIRQAK